MHGDTARYNSLVSFADPAGKRIFADDMTLENAIHVPLYTPGWEWVFAVRPEVEGFFVAPFVYPNFSDVKLGG